MVIDRRNHHLFQPLLYQVATATLSPAEIAVPIRRVLRRQRHAQVLLGEVEDVDVQRRRVVLEGRVIPYDFLVVATGSDFSYFGHPEWAEYAPGLKSIEDATTIRRRVLLAFERAEMTEDAAERARCLTFVLVGGGPTGVEMAGAIADMARNTLAPDFRRINPARARVILLEAAPRLLGGMPECLAEYAKRALERRGVEVRLNCPVEQVDAAGVIAAGERIESASVVWSAGVAPSGAGRWLGIRTDKAGRVEVEPDLSVPGHPEIFVIGDTAHAPGPDGQPLPGLAPVAKQQGAYVARVLRARIAGRAAPGPFRYRNYGAMATIGRRAAVADFGWLKVDGTLAWLLWGLIHVTFLIGFRNRFVVLFDWLWSYATFQSGARLITGPGSH